MAKRRKQFCSFDSEAQLAGAFQTHLESIGWDCYPEVAVNRGGARADIVAYRKPLVWVVEAKMAFNEAVCEQAKAWLHYAHIVTVLVPDGRSHPILTDWCQRHGVGVVRAWRHESYGTRENQFDFNTTVEHRLHRSVYQDGRYIAERLHPDMKRFAPGTSGAFSSPWRRTMDEAVRIIKDNPGVGVKSIVATLKHHYHSDATARACLIKWLQHDKRVRCERQGRAVCFWMADAPPIGQQQQLEAVS
jgi:hypothetical protein